MDLCRFHAEKGCQLPAASPITPSASSHCVRIGCLPPGILARRSEYMSGISRLEEPLELPTSVLTTSPGDRGPQPIVVYVDVDFLRQVDLTLPDQAGGDEPCSWKRFAHRTPEAWGACLGETTAEVLLNQWAERIVAKVDALLPRGAHIGKRFSISHTWAFVPPASRACAALAPPVCSLARRRPSPSNF